MWLSFIALLMLAVSARSEPVALAASDDEVRISAPAGALQGGASAEAGRSRPAPHRLLAGSCGGSDEGIAYVRSAHYDVSSALAPASSDARRMLLSKANLAECARPAPPPAHDERLGAREHLAQRCYGRPQSGRPPPPV